MSAAFLLTIIPANLTISVLSSEYAFDVIAMSETWLDSSILITDISLPCYSEPHRLDRNRSGGGVLTFVKSNIYCIRRLDLESPNVEVLWLEMCLKIYFIHALLYATSHLTQMPSLVSNSQMLLVTL